MKRDPSVAEIREHRYGVMNKESSIEPAEFAMRCKPLKGRIPQMVLMEAAMAAFILSIKC
ncbi:MAG TPA: hypothetical protein DDY43_08715 [Synechococcales bacterium UBA10510]|nr:hypothetical protein [Synechococcales bacterium UBA10510]